MKRIVSFILVFAMCIFLCSCKSKNVQNVERVIDSIGEVTIDSEPAILAAEKAYNDLKDAEKYNVENISRLVDARKSYEQILKIQTLLGDWHITGSSFEAIVSFKEDYTLDVTGDRLSPGTYELTENGVLINVGFPVSLTFSNFEGYDLLEGGGLHLVREEDYDAVYDIVFVEVDLRTADIYDYVDFTYVDYYVDQFSKKHTADRYLVTSKVYDDGLVYWGVGGGTVIEAGDITCYGLFPIGSVLKKPYLGRMEGTIIFIRAEYVSEYVFTETERFVANSLFGNTGHSMSLHHYINYPY